jgi:hypothetical protein
MSLSAESLNLRRKRIATERAINNGDPLVARKKARAVFQPSVTPRTATAAAPAPKDGANVSLHWVLKYISDHCPNRRPTFVDVLLSI